MKRKAHRFDVGEFAKWRICCTEHWDVLITKQTRTMWWLPSYTVIVKRSSGLAFPVYRVLDCQLRKAKRCTS